LDNVKATRLHREDYTKEIWKRLINVARIQKEVKKLKHPSSRVELENMLFKYINIKCEDPKGAECGACSNSKIINRWAELVGACSVETLLPKEPKRTLGGFSCLEKLGEHRVEV
jgi:hypothetical protein